MDLSHEIRVLAHLLRREFEQSEEMTYVDRTTGSCSRVIGFLAHAEGDVYQKDVEAHFSVRRSTASAMVRSLEEKGLLRRESVASDARLKKLCLTEEGWEVHRTVTATLDRIGRQLTDGISEEELEAFGLTLEKMKANLCSGGCACPCTNGKRKETI